jgi:hypothetical protein
MHCILNVGFVLVLLAAPATAEPTTQVYEVPGGAQALSIGHGMADEIEFTGSHAPNWLNHTTGV